jgi:hypothetical protein
MAQLLSAQREEAFGVGLRAVSGAAQLLSRGGWPSALPQQAGSTAGDSGERRQVAQ